MWLKTLLLFGVVVGSYTAIMSNRSQSTLGELKNQFSFTRAALSTCARAKRNFLSIQLIQLSIP
jgi:hypothetical protein